jgi:hypothetical protein
MAFHRFVDGQAPKDIEVTEEFEGVPDIGIGGAIDPTRNVPAAFRASCSDRVGDAIRIPYSFSAYGDKAHIQPPPTASSADARIHSSSSLKSRKAPSNANPRGKLENSESKSKHPDKTNGKRRGERSRQKRSSKKKMRSSDDEL